MIKFKNRTQLVLPKFVDLFNGYHPSIDMLYTYIVYAAVYTILIFRFSSLSYYLKLVICEAYLISCENFLNADKIRGHAL